MKMKNLIVARVLLWTWLCSLVRSLAEAQDIRADFPLAKDQDSFDTHSFGGSMMREHFQLNYTNFNHGSFGACPKSVLKYQSSLRLQQEQQPDVWMRQRYRQLLNETRAKVASYIGLLPSQEDGLVLVESASTAVNSIMRSYPWTQGDVIVYFSVAYAMVKNTATWLAETEGVQIVQVPVAFPIGEEQAESAFLDPMQQALQHLPDPSKLKMVVLDHMVSVPAVKEPIDQLAAMVKTINPTSFVLVDGAHILGQTRDLNISRMSNVDAYLSNGHKWLYSAKGSAFLWVNQSSITATFPEPTVISSGNLMGPTCTTSLSQRYEYVSSRDYTAFLSMSAAIDFRHNLMDGGDLAIYKYCRTLALQAKHYLLELWNATALAPDSIEEFMINIELPAAINSPSKGLALHNYLLDHHNTYMLVLGSGQQYTRLSSQIYLEMDDFQRLGDLVLKYITIMEEAQWSTQTVV